MEKMKLKEIQLNKQGQVAFRITSDPEICETKNGGNYVRCEITDGESSETLKIWEVKQDDMDAGVVVRGGCYSAAIKKGLYQDAFTFSCKKDNLEVLPDSEKAGLIMMPPKGILEMWQRIMEILAQFSGNTAALARFTLEENKAKFQMWSAAEKLHHNLYGGLLYHVYRMALCCTNIATIANKRISATLGFILQKWMKDENLKHIIQAYVQDNTYLLPQSAIIAYYLAKIYGLDTDIVLAAMIIREGRLSSPVGPVYYQDKKVREICQKDNIPMTEKVMLFRHCLYVSENKPSNIPEGILCMLAERIAEALKANASKIDGELLISACLLHDIGKLRELATDEAGSAKYTVEGTLFNHAIIGIEMIESAAERIGMAADERLLHCIASHHGKLEWGALVEPVGTEACILHEVDILDARLYAAEEAVKTIKEGEFSGRIFMLDNARMYHRQGEDK